MAAKNRVLVTGLSNNLGGTEAVVGRYVDALRDEFVFDFLSIERLTKLDFVRQGGSRSYIAPSIRAPFARKHWLRAFFADRASNYHAVWAHFNHLLYSDILVEAARVGVPVRIAHAHNTQFLGGAGCRAASNCLRGRTVSVATKRLACSDEAGAFFWSGDYEVVPNAFDLDAYAFSEVARDTVRRQLGIAEGAFVIGSVGRLTEQKNHAFLVELLPQLIEQRGGTKLVIVGAGPASESLRQQADALGVGDSLILTGERNDVANVLSAFDVFAFPSLFEGLPVSFLEAQANGLPCVCSDSIARAAIISHKVKRVMLSDSICWVKALLDVSRPNSLNEKATYFDIWSQRNRMAHFLRSVDGCTKPRHMCWIQHIWISRT